MFLVGPDCMTSQEQQIKAEIERLAEITSPPATGASPEIGTALNRISELAAHSFPQSASVAAQLWQRIGQDGAQCDQVLRDGLLLLEEAFGAEGQQHEVHEEGPPPIETDLADDPELLA